MQRHLLLAMILVACTGDDSDSDAPLALAIAGAWVDDFGGTHDIDESTWDMGDFGLFHIDRFDNDAAFLVAHNDAGNTFSPDLWSRMDWSIDGSNAWFCQTAYDAADADAALATPAADATDPAIDGCGGFPWSYLTPR